MLILIALAIALAVWVATGPDAGTVRLAALRRPSARRPSGRVRGRSGPGHASARSGVPARRVGARFTLRPRRARTAAAWRALSIELCHGIHAELVAGRMPGEALVNAIAAVEPPDPAALTPVVAAVRDGGDVAAALLSAAPEEGGEGLVRLAACWRVSTSVGGGLAALVDRLAASLREAEAHRQEVAAQLAGPRATARMLAALPLLGLLMATALGVSPLPFLLGSPAGHACLLIGLALDAAGVWWTRRLADRAIAAPVTGGGSR